MKNGPKYTYTLKREALKPVSEIKSNPNFATPGTEFKATKPGTSINQKQKLQVIELKILLKKY